ncbi:MAG: ribonuclease P protein component [Chromatiales bacterium]|jgi:ribonuclease P protein component
MPVTGNRFRKANRLLRAVEFQSVFEHPVRSVDACFTILAKQNQSATARLGLAISKKNLRRAVDRNRIKRLARESFRRNAAGLAGLDLVIMAKQSTATRHNAELLESLQNHWSKLASKTA